MTKRKAKANNEITTTGKTHMVAHFFIDGAVVLRDTDTEVTETDILLHCSDPRSEYTEAIMTDDGSLWASDNSQDFVLALAIYMNGEVVNYPKLLEALGFKEQAEQIQEMREFVDKHARLIEGRE